MGTRTSIEKLQYLATSDIGLLAFKPLYEEHNLKLPNEKLPFPSFLAIITDEGMAYRRPDGVYVIPIGCLTM